MTPVTKGKRYAFLASMYGEEDVARREANNAKLHASELQYTGGRVRLFPEEAKLEGIASVA